MSNKNPTNYSPSINLPNTSNEQVPFDIEEVGDSDLFTKRNASPLSFSFSYSMTGERLDKALAIVLTQYSRNQIQTWITQGRVNLNGHIEKVIRCPVFGGDRVELIPTLSNDIAAYSPESMILNTVYEDTQIIVLNKPVGLVVHPATGNWHGTLMNGLLYRYPELTKLPRAGIVHRLDKDTSGLMVVARTLTAQIDLVRQLQARTMKRSYLALVLGETPRQGTIEAPIGRDPYSRTKMAIVDNGKPARTHFYRLATVLLGNMKISLIRCELDTGRTHQIRVHLASLKHPLIGDILYGRKVQLPISFTRQALHAYELGLLHPEKRTSMQWRIDLPEDMMILATCLGLPTTLTA